MAIETEDLKVDVGVLKSQVQSITELCSKMDTVIEKLVDQHDRHLVKVYETFEARRKETDTEMKEIHERIDTVLDKMQATEKNLMDEIKLLRKEMADHNKNEKESLDKLLQWKWMVAGGILVLSWLISHVKLDTILLK